MGFQVTDVCPLYPWCVSQDCIESHEFCDPGLEALEDLQERVFSLSMIYENRFVDSNFFLDVKALDDKTRKEFLDSHWYQHFFEKAGVKDVVD